VGVVSSSQFSSAEGAAEQALLTMDVTPAGSGFAIRTAKSRLTAPPPPARFPTERVQVEPGPAVGVQVHPGDELAATKVVWSGTPSVSVTDAAAWFPTFVAVRR
jgi:hypothetical protein